MSSYQKLNKLQIAWRAAQDLEHNSYVNLGIGFPEMIASFQPEGRDVIYHSENGILGFGPRPAEGEEDWDLISAGKEPITIRKGSAIFDSADSFGIMRGGHLDLAVLGAYQIAQNGDLANWNRGVGGVPAVGGAMDLVQGAKKVIVVTDHVAKDGAPKLVSECSFPLTGLACVSRIYSSHAVVDIVDGHFVLREKCEGLSMDELQSMTGAPLHLDGPVSDLITPAL